MGSYQPTHSKSAEAAFAYYPAELFQQQNQGEFRRVLTLFINLPQLPHPNSNSPFIDAFYSLLAQYGGYLCRLGRIGSKDEGGTFLLFWGAPTSYENDIERVLNFLLALEQASGIPLRAGLTHQIAYAGFVGTSLREEYTCYGLSVNLAARLMTSAPIGAIWVDEAIYRRAEDQFAFVPEGDHRFKGFAEPLPVFRLLDRQAIGKHSLFQGEMVGRSDQLDQLIRIFTHLKRGQSGGIIMVHGEAGIGKSRLVHEFLDQIDGNGKPQRLICQTNEILRDALNPFRYLLNQLFHQSPNVSEQANKQAFDRVIDQLIDGPTSQEFKIELDRTRSFLGALVGLTWANSLYTLVAPNLRLENTFIALKTFFKAESLRQPITLVLEDGQWLDEVSRQFLADFGRDVATYPITLLMTTRSDTLDFDLPADVTIHKIQLNSLSSAAVSEMAQAALNRPPAQPLIDLLLERTEGNPFFVEQLLLYLEEEGLLLPSDEGVLTQSFDAPLPPDLHAVLVARIDRLSQTVRSVVQTAAVLGREFDRQILVAMFKGEADISGRIEAAASAEIWQALSELRYLFRHSLLRDAAYQMQLLSQRQLLHRFAAETIEEYFATDLAAVYSDLAFHYQQADIAEKERAYTSLAGRQAAARYDNDQAVAYFSRALTLTMPEAVDERYRLLMDRVAVFHFQGNRTAQRDDLDHLQAILPELSAEAQAKIFIQEARYAEAVGDYEQMIAMTEAALNLAAQIPTSNGAAIVAEATLEWGIGLIHQGKFDDAQTKLEVTESYAATHDMPELQAMALEKLSELFSRQGKQEIGKTYGLRAIELTQQIKTLSKSGIALNNVGICALYLGDYEEANHYFAQSLEVKREVGDRRQMGAALQNLGIVATFKGELDLGAKYYEDALQIRRETSEKASEGLVLNNLGVLYRMLGQYETAEEYLQQAMAFHAEVGHGSNIIFTYNNFGALHHHLGRLSEAQTYSEKGLKMARELNIPQNQAPALIDLGHIFKAMGKLDRSYAAYSEAIEISEASKQQTYVIEAKAGLLTLPYKDETRYRSRLEEVVAYLHETGIEGISEGFRVYLNCYQALAADSDVRANDLLTAAVTLLRNRAAKLSDPALQASMLHNEVVNRKLLDLFDENSSNRSSSETSALS